MLTVWFVSCFLVKNFEKFKIRFQEPQNMKFFYILTFAKYLAKLLSTMVYKIIEFLLFCASSKIFKI